MRQPRGPILKDLIFSVTYRCNLRCRTCYYGRTMDEAVRHSREELTLEEIGKIARVSGDIHGLLLSGGEPFLREDLAEICGVFADHSHTRAIHLPTNGYLAEEIHQRLPEILRRCAKAMVLVALPLDGLRETHDAIKGAAGSFDRVVETTMRLAELKRRYDNFKVSIITTVTAGNIDDIIPLAEFVRNMLPVDGHGPSPLRGSPYDRTVSAPSADQWRRLAKALMPYHAHWNTKAHRSRLRAFLDTNRARYLYGLYAMALEGRRPASGCHAGTSIGVLEPDGGIRLCEQSAVIGNIRSFDYNLARVWAAEEAVAGRREITGCACAHACFLLPAVRAFWPARVASLLCAR